jgi:hypothetical protein
MLERFASNQVSGMLATSQYTWSVMMLSDARRQEMINAFQANLPIWTDADAAAFHRANGEIVSVAIHRAIPYGITAKFVAANGTAFGPMLLNPIVVDQLKGLLQQEGFA